MEKQIYNKLVRDKIPEIITSNGDHPLTRILSDDHEFELMLYNKILEEVHEYLEDGNVEELADIMEVIYAILKFKNIEVAEFEKIIESKRIKKGGFDNRILLKEVILK